MYKQQLENKYIQTTFELNFLLKLQTTYLNNNL